MNRGSYLFYFNSRPSARGDRKQPTTMPQLPNHFNSRPSARGDAKLIATRQTIFAFQFTPLREGRPENLAGLKAFTTFQFTPLREGRRDQWGNWVRKIKFQFTPLREGRHLYYPPFGVIQLISIHAPPRGATICGETLSMTNLFQFTPLREGRRQKICNFCKSFVQPLQISMA